ncbi:MAG: hypothetical protein QM820_61305 [Minicystis sp.]
MCLPLTFPCDYTDPIGGTFTCTFWCSASCQKLNGGACVQVGSAGFCACL